MLAVDAVLGVVMGLLVLAQATLLAETAARAFGGAALDELARPLIVLAAVVTARAATAYGFEAVGRRAAVDAVSTLRVRLVERRLHDRPYALDSAESAELATVAVNGADALETTFSRYLPQVVLAVVIPVAVLCLVGWIDPLSAGLMLLTLPLIPVFMWLVGRYTEQRTRARWQALTLLATHFLDVVRGLPTLRAFNRSGRQSATIAEVSEEYRRTTTATLRVAFLSGAVLELAATLGIALVAVTIGVRLVDGNIGLQAGLTVLVLAPELYLPLRNLAAQFHASADGRAVTNRLLDLLDAPAPALTGSAAPPSPRYARLRLEDVSFTYPRRDEAALDGVELELDPGETVALVGPSGAGKSTIAALLLGLATPTAGRVTLGGRPLSEFDVRDWRRQVAWVPQRPTLFRRTIADNIRLGGADFDDAEIRDAARLAGADAFVSRLADGYATVVGDGGRRLSAGEAQRIALARAFLRNSPLVLLDEPTANLDPENAALVAEAVRRIREHRMVLLITHSTELAAEADRIVELRGGRIAEPAVAA
jgi:ATP-binding cassette, subfamily C, bacterial CydD